jgi:RHS repeat-associated protein
VTDTHVETVRTFLCGAFPPRDNTATGSTTYTPGVSQRNGSTDLFLHEDWLGSTRYLTDSQGTAPTAYRFDAYGNTSASGGPDSTVLKFGGQHEYQSDLPLGLQQLGARVYPPAAGRFLSPDPIGFAGGANVYGSCGNEPVGFVDPLGLLEEKLSGLEEGIVNGLGTTGSIIGALGGGGIGGGGGFAAGIVGGPTALVTGGVGAWTVGAAGAYAGYGAGRALGHAGVHVGRAIGAGAVKLGQWIGGLMSKSSCGNDGGGSGGSDSPGKFRGPNAKSFDWGHIFENHAPWGKVAQQRTRGTIFRGLNKQQIMARVRAAWRVRERMSSQVDPFGVSRIRFRGVDPASKQTVEMWLNEATKEVETAYPID